MLNSGDERFGGCKLNPGCSVRSNATVGSRPMTCGERGVKLYGEGVRKGGGGGEGVKLYERAE